MSAAQQEPAAHLIALLVAEPNLAAYVDDANEIGEEGGTKTEEDEFDGCIEILNTVSAELDAIENCGALDGNTISEDAADVVRMCTRGAIMLLVAASRARKHLRPLGDAEQSVNEVEE